MLNKQKGDMYDFVTHTWNTVKGKCPHECSYCYMKNWGKQADLHFDEKELKTNLGEGNFIFVGSSCDMWAENIPAEWIHKTLAKIIKSDDKNKYLFQSKNPKRFLDFFEKDYKVFSRIKYVFGTTIESNHDYPISTTPQMDKRATAIREMRELGFQTMITIEPILDFELNNLINLLRTANPFWINIGADSGRNNLPEPSKEKVLALIEGIKELKIEIKQKKNLGRLLR